MPDPADEQPGNGSLSVAIEESGEVSESLSFLRALLGTSVAAVAVVDASGSIVYANNSAEQTLGLHRPEGAGNAYNAPDWTIEHVDGSRLPDEELPFRRVLASGAPVQASRYAIVWPSGKRRILSVSAASLPLPGASGTRDQPLIALGLSDVTERHKASAGRRVRRKVLEKLAANVPGMMYQYQQWPDGGSAFVYSSTGIQDVYGISREDVARDASTVFDLIDARDLERVAESIQSSARSLSLWHCEYRVNHPRKGSIWVEGRATPEALEDGSVLWHGHIEDITKRKQFVTELALANNMVDQATVGFHVYRLEDPANDGSLRMIRVNPASERLIGLSADALEGRRIDDIFPPLRGLGIPQIYAEVARSGQSQNLPDTNFIDTHGMEHTFSVAAFPLDDYCVAAVFEDITERRQLNDALSESEARFRQLAEAINDVVWIRTSQKMLYVNPAYEKVFGYTTDQLYKNPNSFLDCVHPEDRSRVFKAVEDELQQRSHFDQVYRIVRPDGEVRWLQVQSHSVRESGYDGRSAGTAIDITRLKNYENQLRDNQKLLSLAQRIAGLGHWASDLETGHIQWSDEVYRILGYPSRAFQPTYEQFMSAVHPADRADVEEAMAHATGSADNEYRIEHRIVRPDKTVRCVLQQGEVTFSGDGDAIRMVGTILDITERKQLETELKKLATTDSLTGLLNRRELSDRIVTEIARMQRTGDPRAGVLMLDIDHFKAVNDRYGHSVGDQVLVDFARIMIDAVRSSDLVARLGGEEFAIVLPGASVESALLRAEKIRNTLAENTFSSSAGHRFQVTVSIGITGLDTQGADPVSDALNRADKALYQSKKNGRNRIETLLEGAGTETG